MIRGLTAPRPTPGSAEDWLRASQAEVGRPADVDLCRADPAAAGVAVRRPGVPALRGVLGLVRRHRRHRPAARPAIAGDGFIGYDPVVLWHTGQDPAEIETLRDPAEVFTGWGSREHVWTRITAAERAKPPKGVRATRATAR